MEALSFRSSSSAASSSSSSLRFARRLRRPAPALIQPPCSPPVNHRLAALCSLDLPPLPALPPPVDSRRRQRRREVMAASAVSSSAEGGDEKEEKELGEEVEQALGMEGSIPGGSQEFVRRVSSRAYGMRRNLMQSIDSVSYDVVESNPWREDSKPVYVLITQRDNKLWTMKTRRNHSEVERELGLLFSKGISGKTKKPNIGSKFQMLVEDITEGVLVFEDEHEATRYCDLLQGGGQGCEGIAELEASSVFDICRKMRALAVLFRRGRTPPLPKSLEQNLRARKRSLEDQDLM